MKCLFFWTVGVNQEKIDPGRTERPPVGNQPICRSSLQEFFLQGVALSTFWLEVSGPVTCERWGECSVTDNFQIREEPETFLCSDLT